MRLTFSPSSTRTTIIVNITNDDAYELTETFRATLSFNENSIQFVILSPDAAIATIMDDDGEW